MAVESLSDDICRLRTRIEMLDDKMSSQSVEEEKIPPTLSMNCSSDETARANRTTYLVVVMTAFQSSLY
jgi:hypothetical protein